MEYQVKKVAMTGGSGGVGMALIKKLLSENIEILLFQRKESPRSQYLPKHKLLHIEYCRLEELKDYIPKENDFDVFFHLGWANTAKWHHNNVEKQNENVVYASWAVELANKMGCHTFIGAGSQAEYGRHDEPVGDDTLCEPESMYGVMKLCVCYATRILCRRFNMRHIWMRILSGYGKYDNKYSLIVSAILDKLDGKPLKFSEGKQIWDFVYMDDVANAFYLAARRGKNNAIYAIGSGKARYLKEYIKILCEKLGEDAESGLGELPYSDSQIMHLEADISKLQEDTGWKPEMEFEDGIERVIAFYKEWKPWWEEHF